MSPHQIPMDLIIDILVWLPVKTLLRFKSVCKEWGNLINIPRFIQLHLHKSLVPNSRLNRALFYTDALCIVDDIYHPLKLTKLKWPDNTIRDNEGMCSIGSCTGLFCFLVMEMKTICRNLRKMSGVSCFLICNPSTRTFKSIIPSPNETYTKLGVVVHGFGYDSEHDDYKIVTTSRVYGDVCIYSLKAGSWRCVAPTAAAANPSKIMNNWRPPDYVIYANNMLYYHSSAADEFRVARFDLSLEKWMDDLSLPVQVKSTNNVRFGVLDGLVYVRLGYLSSDVWIHGVDDSWSKIFHLPEELYHYSPIAHSMDKPPRLLLRCFGKNTIWYDPENDNRVLFQPEASPRLYETELYIASLVEILGCSLAKMQQIDESSPAAPFWFFVYKF